ncbi:hypothetical protein ACEZDB_17870 [Streptacidiphilus sp. N1-3]|uniref:Proteinase inhibitor I42 chagasin domain-containing protein n=1 Tax=Streptacidiphilus alkalitolerans TaxID=3342712 RepID=A0ABV6X3H2_9ACTN
MIPWRSAAGLLLTLVTLAGCASGSTGAGPGAPASPPSGSGGRTASLDEHAAGSTVSVPRGTTVLLTLHSTYWAPARSSAPALLQPLGGATSSAAAVGPGCRPGAGCGTVVSRFLALRGGRVTLSSARTSCGEAMACRPAERTFRVTIVVTAP